MSRSVGESDSRLILRAENFAKKYQRAYLFFVVALVIAGYAYLLFSPAVVITAFYFLHELVPAAETTQDWVQIGVISFFAFLFMIASVRTVMLRFPRVQGLKLSKAMVPDLYDVIAEVREHYKRPAIKDIVITDNFELRIESIPRVGIPVLSFNTLVIGLPLLQTMTPDDFRCGLSRCIGQHSGIMPRLTLFIYKARRLWGMYNSSLGKHKKLGEGPLRWFFRWYFKLFELVALPAIRMEELEADLFALDYINEKEVFEALKSETISRVFLESHYWPNVRKMALKHPSVLIKPFSNIEKVVRGATAQQNRKKWLAEAYAADQFPGDDMPGFRQRMEYIGHAKIRSIPVLGMNAAEKYLGDTRKNIVPIIDKLWRSTTLSQWMKKYKEQCRNVGKIKDLSARSRQEILWPKDIFYYACLAKKLHGNSIGSSVNKILRSNIKNMTPAFIANRMQSQ